MPDEVARRMANRANLLQGVYLTLNFPCWDEANDHWRNFWRAVAQVSQYPEPKARKKGKTDGKEA